jgi:hypothetical protein
LLHIGAERRDPIPHLGAADFPEGRKPTGPIVDRNIEKRVRG